MSIREYTGSDMLGSGGGSGWALIAVRGPCRLRPVPGSGRKGAILGAALDIPGPPAKLAHQPGGPAKKKECLGSQTFGILHR